MSWLEEIDRSLFLWLNGMHTESMDGIMQGISSPYFGIPFYIVAIYYLFNKRGARTGFFLLFGAVATVALADLASVHLFKDLIQRYRPSHNLEIEHLVHLVDGYKGGKFGFVSSHAANMFGLATFIGLAVSRKALLIGWIIAAIIGYSRIYLGVHYPADILVGGMLGSAIAYIVYRFVNNLCSEQEP